MLKGNREKRKINTNDGLITTAGKKIVWHLYVIPMTGPTLGFNWPRKLLLELDDILRAIDYIVRESLELAGKDEALVVHYDPKGCKGYNMQVPLKPNALGLGRRGFLSLSYKFFFDPDNNGRPLLLLPPQGAAAWWQVAILCTLPGPG